jgi:hypothetical protein
MSHSEAGEPALQFSATMALAGASQWSEDDAALATNTSTSNDNIRQIKVIHHKVLKS